MNLPVFGAFSSDCCVAEELLSLLGSGLGSVAEEELEEAMGRVREEGGGRESRTGLYELSDPLLQVGGGVGEGGCGSRVMGVLSCSLERDPDTGWTGRRWEE